MAVKISSVEPDSPAHFAGLRAGDTLISINEHEIIDVLDYRFYETDRCLHIQVKDTDGEVRTVDIRKGQYESIGLDFETYLMDKQRSCANKCIFCFIDQLPKGMRPSLYFKDDDSRLSFLFGNYITLTNLSKREVDRILQMHISPVNVSVHTTNPELRVKMMGNRFAGRSLDVLWRLAEGGIHLNCQVVLCPGINDGAELERTLTDLGRYVPNVQSIAMVPLGVTRFREGLYPLTPYTKEGAQEVIRIVDHFGDAFQVKCGSRVCYASDEVYLLAQQPIPEPAYYGDFDQLENGVGLFASMKQEFHFAMDNCNLPQKPRHISLATGTSAGPFLHSLLDELRRKCNNFQCTVYPVKNRFFGETITVAGLVTGGDLISQLRGKDLGDELLIPSVMLRHEGDLFLDDIALEQVQQELGVPVHVVPNDGYELFLAVTGSEEDV